MEASNVKAMREAVRSILNLAYEVAAETEEPRCKISNDWLIETCKAALAAPPRNCDVGTAVEQESRWRTNCGYGIPNCKHCKVYEEAKNSGLVNGRYLMRCDCRFIWAQMPYEEGGEKC